MKKAVLVSCWRSRRSSCPATALARIRSGTSRSTATARSSLSGRARLRPLRPRPGRDPHRPGGRRGRAPGFAARVAERLVLELDGRRVALVPLEHEVASGPGPAASTRSASTPSSRAAGAEGRTLEFHDPNFERRLGWKEVVVVASGRRRSAPPPTCRRRARATRCAPTPRPSLLTARRELRRVEYEPGERAGDAAAAGRVDAGGSERWWRLRVAHRARRPRCRRRPRLAARGDVLGRGARAHARARQGDRRRLPRRHARDRAARCSCSA